MITGILVKILSIVLLILVGVVLVLGIGTLLKGGDTFGMADTSRVVSPEERMDILQGIQF